MPYDSGKHVLLRQVAHRYCLYDDEYPAFLDKLQEAGIKRFPVDIPAWPPVPYGAPEGWAVFGSMWYDDMTFTGRQDAVSATHATKRDIIRIAREMMGDDMSPKRIAYAWQVELYDPKNHIIMRQWLADNELDIVKFLREHIPQIRQQTGRDPLVDVVNPTIQDDIAAGNSWDPTRRAVIKSDMAVLDSFGSGTKKFTYNLDQQVTWRKSLDGSRWEARRQDAPQSGTWMSNRSYIVRGIREGAWTEEDRDPVEGYPFGPFMELWPDGTLHVWVAKRALEYLENSPMTINGVKIQLKPEAGVHVWRMIGSIPPDAGEMQQILNGAPDITDTPTKTADDKVNITIHVPDWKDKSPFFEPVTPVSDKRFHRDRGRPSLVARLRQDGTVQVRIWGDRSLNDCTITLNGVRVAGWIRRAGGWYSNVPASNTNQILNRKSEKGNQGQEPEPEDDITAGARAYSTTQVREALARRLDQNPRFFGKSVSDSAIVALTRQGMEKYLAESTVDKMTYVLDRGNRNFDCENFAEALRVGLQSKYGVNGIGIIWGDGHAWNFFVVVGETKPDIVMVEPQTDMVVDSFDGNYSIERRCEVLL